MGFKTRSGDGKMKEISDYIYEGALAFLKAEYRLLTFFVIGAIVLAGISFIVPTTHILIVVAFIFGAFFSLAGNMGMKIATKQMLELLKPHVRVCLKP
jgi:K(+)-stimulated pyrophosphate-energized sodium pump